MTKNNLNVSSVIRALLPFLLLWVGLSFACSPTLNSSDQVVRYTATLTTEPDDQTALVNRCAHYIDLERYAEAVADCTRVLQLQPNNIHARQNRATAYQRWRRLSQSLVDWEQVLALMEQSEFWRTNGPERIDDARNQIRSIHQQLESGS